MGKVITHEDGTQAAEFSYDFAMDEKAVKRFEDENGDLIIEGYASDFGLDRQDEAFEPGAFQRGLKTFLATNPIMLYHHKYDKALGQFTDALVDEHGLWVRGRVDKPAAGSWAEDVYNKIKRGTIKSFSVGGLFKRRMTPNGPRIYDVDLGEISVTPFPVNPRTNFAVIAGKAFEEAPELEVVAEEEEVAETGPTTGEPPETGVESTPAPSKSEDDEEGEQEEAVEEELEAAEEEETPEALADGSVTAEKIAPGSINTDHLSDELRSRFSELQAKPDEITAEEVAQRVSELADRLGQVIEHAGVRLPNAGDGPNKL